ncbi:MAG: hypothetical protein QG565_526 [Campylobacterota bacterium]|nr:hypothetical protein [Campylobacterota bacterium]MDQ1267858.1 hypothetical protein [Campylobacterota bacterium]MDQ1338207.1 hypothetical protein [Campylobacterota bacterium]
MKAIILTLFLTALLLASDNKDVLRAQIISKIISNISINEVITVWSDNKELIAEFKKSNHITTTDDCDKASIVVVENAKAIEDKDCKNKLIFVLNYDLLKDVPKSFGAFFWKKGRPNIVIIKPRALSQGITVAKELEAYVEEKIW